MKEFIEKLIGRLEENGQKMCEAKSSVPYGKHSSSNHRYYKAISVKKAIHIVNQLAEEYNEYNNESIKGDLISRSLLLDCLSYYISHTDEKSGEHYAYERAKDLIEKQPKSYNNGWITDRVPTKEECGEFGYKEFQVTIPQTEGNKTITMDFEYTTVRGKEVARWKWCGRLSPWKVLAWKPLSEPYTEEV